VKSNTKSIEKILIITLGCSKNLVESEQLITQLKSNGIEVSYNKELSDEKTVIINTCGFINDAKKESIDTILFYADAKNKGIIDNLIVFGCLTQLYKDELKKLITEIDEIFGTNNINQIIEYLHFKYNKDFSDKRFITTPSHYAYLKISDGCNRKCTFCAIPTIKGKYKSVPIEKLISEAEYLAANGVKELILVGQDTSVYGIDIYGKNTLASLLEKLSRIKNIEWIRLHYTYPVDFPDEILSIIKNNDKICKYLDIPFQHISNSVLRKMKRGITKSDTLKLIEKIRKKLPNITLRTTLITGFPDETDKDFNELYDFVKETKFDRLGVFIYSHEEFTYAYTHHTDNIPMKVKKQRYNSIMKLQKNISFEKNLQKINSIINVIVDYREGDFFICRSQGDSPEVDNEVLVKYADYLTVGSIIPVEIYNCDHYDLFGKAIKKP